MKVKDVTKRTPDKETESLRIWKTDVNEVKDYDEEEGFEIEYEPGKKLKCCGFTKISDRETGELLFAYKFKHEGKFILYYMPKETPKAKEMFEFLDYLTMNIGYGLENINETIKNMKHELNVELK